jgi:hypothetical protein
MKARLLGICAAFVALMILGFSAVIPHGVHAQSAMGHRTTVLNVTTEDGVPKAVDAKTWDKAFGIAEMSMGSDGSDTIVVEASGLVPDGLYTLWWVNMKPSMTMGPAVKPPDNEFKADTKGNASISFKVPSKNDYQTLFIAYHADDRTHGADPGKSGVETFSQLMGAFPGPAGMLPAIGMESMATMAATQAAGMGDSTSLATILKATDESGIPKGIDKAVWSKAIGVAWMSMGSNGTDTIVVKLGRLVPDGLYTLWWVNMKPSMTMGPAVKPPDNEFKTDANGNATVTFTVSSKNDYQTLFVAFHADGKTHGTDPGKSGVETFSQLMGAFPGSAGMSPDISMENAATMAPTSAK